MKRIQTFLFPAAAALIVTALCAAGIFDRLDRWMQDAICQNKGVTSTDIVIFGIDETALDEFGPYNSWDRNIMAAALEALASDPEHLPAAVAVDVLYAGSTDPESDARLANAAERLGCVVTATVAQFGEKITWDGGRAVSIDMSAVIRYDEPYEALKNASTPASINVMVDRDGILRHALLYVQPDGERVYSMAYQTASLYMAQKGLTVVEPKTTALGNYYISYNGKPGDYYDGISLAWLVNGMVPSGYWADKIVLIGPYATALQDAYYTTIDKGREMYGIEIQANVIQNIISGNYKTEADKLPQLIALFVLCCAAMTLFVRLKVLPGGAVCLGFVGAGIGMAFGLYALGLVIHPLWLSASVIILYVAALAEHYRTAAKERHALELEKERIGAELELATRIQSSSLIKDFPPFPDRREFDIYASMDPAKDVVGDLYDFFMIDDDHLGLVIADVSGKGVPASLFTMLAMTLIRHVAGHELSPAKVLEIVNGDICARNPEEMFITVWMGVLEISTGKLTAANAGHEFPAIRTPGGRFELFKDRHGFVIGGMEGVRYREYTLDLEPGSKLFVYTDGVAEATNAHEELFGTERMIDALNRDANADPKETLLCVRRAVDEFVGSAPQFDDLTMLCLRYNGKN